MPKKFRGENTKAASAKERKAGKEKEDKEQRDKDAEDALWKDDDKNLAKKNLRKDDKERKRLEDLQRKHENKLLAEEEDAEEAPIKPPPTKVTQFQLQQQQQQKAAAAASGAGAAPTHLDTVLMENTNRLEDVVSASGVDDAIRALRVDDASSDQPTSGRGHVNMAAAFKAYEEHRLSSLKKENPTLKLSQLKQKLRKEWQKSPDNPLNKVA